MGTGWIFAGFLFLINPDLITFDIFPDFLGYLFIAKGLSKLSFLEDRIAIARRFVHYLAFAGAAKLISSSIVFTTTVESTRLTVSFVFFVAELWLSLVFVDNAFKGIQYLAIRKDGDLALKGYEVSKFFVTAFFIVKNICNFLPTSTAIFFPNVDADADLVENYTEMVATFRTLRSIFFIVGAVVTLSFGIYAARILHVYLSRCRSDENFCLRLLESYEERVSKNESMQSRLAVKSGFWYFFLAFLFLADLYLDDIGLIPQFFFPLFVFLGMKKLEKELELPRWNRYVAFASAVIGAAAYLYRTVRLFTVENISDFGVSFVTDPVALVLGTLSAALCIVAGVLMLLAVKSCAKKHTSYGYRVYFSVLVVALPILCGISFAQYRYPSTFSVLPSVQWGVWAVSLYLHKKSLDEIREETDYKLM